MCDPHQALLDDVREAIELVNLPGGSEEFQRRLTEAESTPVTDIAMLRKVISLAYATSAVCDAGAAGMFEGWYRDRAKALLRNATETLVMLEEQVGTSSMH